MRGGNFTVQVSERLPEQVNTASAEAIACWKCLPDLKPRQAGVMQTRSLTPRVQLEGAFTS